jgi:hypothetical protein
MEEKTSSGERGTPSLLRQIACSFRGTPFFVGGTTFTARETSSACPGDVVVLSRDVVSRTVSVVPGSTHAKNASEHAENASEHAENASEDAKNASEGAKNASRAPPYTAFPVVPPRPSLPPIGMGGRSSEPNPPPAPVIPPLGK